MAKEYTIPQLLGLMQIRPYTPHGAAAINKLLNTRDQIEYDTALEVATKEVTGYDNISFHENTDKSYGTNDFGMPIYHPLILDGVPEIDNGKDLMLESAIVSFDRPKDILITKVQGRPKSVKEHINDGDYQIQVTGMISKLGPGYPMDQVMKFKEFMNLRRPLAITHDILNAHDITHIVIMHPKWPSRFPNAQVYGFTALDDEPLIAQG